MKVLRRPQRLHAVIDVAGKGALADGIVFHTELFVRIHNDLQLSLCYIGPVPFGLGLIKLYCGVMLFSNTNTIIRVIDIRLY